ncbi:MAG TPA: UvrD-helicase domain-containing protein [Acidimicrobiales bacterium]|nr:UvrD-helicase domain-containing protein [Acidimicrobiales bacterium]
MQAAGLEDEQLYIDAAYADLARMRARAERLLEEVKGTDPDLDWALLRRVRALREEPRALCFGRIDAEDGDTWYVGRRHVEDEDAEPVIVEWRAPVAVPYYRASRRDPMGLHRRRQFVVDGRRLLSIGDDVFGDQGAAGPDADGERRGVEALLVELERARTGEMLDIVSTIQPEQDEVIRADPAGVLVVQGGPGSGKTAVGLHRAAFLLYGDDAMARANVLVVGPNRTFLRYIAHVLPSLGEHAVVQATLITLVPESEGAGHGPDTPEVERLKGDGRMAIVIAQALASRRAAYDVDLTVAYGAHLLRLDAASIDAEAESIAGRPIPYADGRDTLRVWLLARLAGRYMDATGVLPTDTAHFETTMRASADFKAALDKRWPTVAPATLIADLLAKAAVVEAAAQDILDGTEIRALRRRKGRAWTPADAPLLDEAKALIAGQARTYGHVIVDEAQDLSPMQMRMLARRCPTGSMTLLGDLAQAIGAWAHADWKKELAEWLPTPDGLRVSELRYGYRSTAQIIEFAGRLLAEAAPQVPPTRSVRRGRTDPRVLEVEPGSLLPSLTGEVSRLLAEWPTVGVIVPTALVGDSLEALREALPGRVGDAEIDGLAKPVTVLAAPAAKGLEFDAVLVAEPAAITAEKADRGSGWRLLYVALTRPTQHLSVMTTQPLAPPLTGP